MKNNAEKIIEVRFNKKLFIQKVRKYIPTIEAVLGFISIVALILFVISIISITEAMDISKATGTMFILSSIWLVMAGLYIRFIKM